MLKYADYLDWITHDVASYSPHDRLCDTPEDWLDAIKAYLGKVKEDPTRTGYFGAPKSDRGKPVKDILLQGYSWGGDSPGSQPTLSYGKWLKLVERAKQLKDEQQMAQLGGYTDFKVVTDGKKLIDPGDLDTRHQEWA